MKTKDEMKKKLKKIIKIIILIIYFLNIFIIYSFSKYLYNEDDISLYIKIAKPILILNTDNTIIYDKDLNDNIFNFNISNFENNKISDVNFKYYIKIESNIIDNISYQLYLNDKEINVINNKSEEIILYNKDKNIQNFILRFKILDSSKIDEFSEIKIIIYAYQIN